MTATRHSRLGEATVQELRESVRGAIVDRGDPGYDEARAVWNGDIDRHPELIVQCEGTADVITALRFARSEDLEIAVRGGGHNVAGYGTSDGGLVIDLSPMKGIRVDAQSKRARAQGGVLWGELDHETQAFGLATTGGLISTTGIAGFTLGGGIGWLMRRHGMTIDNLVGADVVTAEGELLRASEEQNTDLFWGLRGGGGNFGIVTEFEYELHDVGPMVYGGFAFYLADKARDLLDFYARWVDGLPDELTTMVAFVIAPPMPFVPAELVGSPMVAVACCHIGDHREAEKSLQPLRDFAEPEIDTVGPVPYTALQAMLDKAAPHGSHSYWRTAYLDGLSTEVIDTIVDKCQGLPDLNPHSTFHLHHLGGAISRVDPLSTAFPHRDRPFVFNTIGMWDEGESRDAHVKWVRDTWDALQQVGAGAPYVNFLSDEGGNDVRAAYGEEIYRRLVELKNRFDPANTFHLNQNIKPSS